MRRRNDVEPDRQISKRLVVLQLAEELGNVSEACRRAGVDRTSFYEWRRRFRAHGPEGLKKLPCVHMTHPQTTPPEVVEKILEMCLLHPDWGCVTLSNWLKIQGICVSSPTVQKILIRHRLGSQCERLLKLQEKHAREGLPLTPEQVGLIDKAYPCFRERYARSSDPGELLIQDTIFAAYLEGIGRVYLQAVLDAYDLYAYGLLHVGKLPMYAVAALEDRVIPAYRRREIPIRAVMTDEGPEFYGGEAHPYEQYLSLHHIQHRYISAACRSNGFMECFKKKVREGLFRKVFQENPYYSISRLHSNFDEWLYKYNN